MVCLLQIKECGSERAPEAWLIYPLGPGRARLHDDLHVLPVSHTVSGTPAQKAQLTVELVVAPAGDHVTPRRGGGPAGTPSRLRDDLITKHESITPGTGNFL